MTGSPDTSTTARVLLGGIVDYAGLFPPASLGLEEAAAEYDSQRASSESWMLGRFVVPAARLPELRAATPLAGWNISALVGPELTRDMTTIALFNDANDGAVDSVEVKAASESNVLGVVTAAPGSCTVYVEVPLGPDLELLLDAVQRAGARAKVRTGGVTADVFPSTTDLAAFVAGCVRRQLAFKATAGLHHPVRAEQALTYAQGAPRGVMHGFLNVFGATALLCAGGTIAQAVALLDETDPAAFTLDQDGLGWRDQRMSRDALRIARSLATGFGSCSFREPVEDLKKMGMLA